MTGWTRNETRRSCYRVTAHDRGTSSLGDAARGRIRRVSDLRCRTGVATGGRGGRGDRGGRKSAGHIRRGRRWPRPPADTFAGDAASLIYARAPEYAI